MKLFISPNHELHDTFSNPVEEGTPVLEQPSRISLILEGLTRVKKITPEGITDHGTDYINRVHDLSYLSFLEQAFSREVESNPAAVWVKSECYLPRKIHFESPHLSFQKAKYLTDSFTQILARTFDAAYWGAQSVISASHSILQGGGAAYALIRPPGHHAYSDQAGGFCFLNNAAIAARALQADSRFKRIALLDIDFHHGNGTQEIFYGDSTVLYCSVHGDPAFAYPYVSGMASETGVEAGIGTTFNCPLARGIGDQEFVAATGSCAEAIARFGADALVLSLGFDAAEGDPYGGFCVTPEGFEQTGQLIQSIGLPTVLVQEGGYLLDRLSVNSEGFFKGYLR